MHKVLEKIESGGTLEVIEDLKKNLFLARPHGMINPTLVAEDLEQAKIFAEKCNGRPWTYCTNTEDVKLVNPFNLLFLKEVKKLKNLKEIVIYAPKFLTRMLLLMASPIVGPDKIFTQKAKFELYLQQVS